MISTACRGQTLISDEQIKKQKWLVWLLRLCSGKTSLNSQRSPRRHSVPWETSWKPSAQWGLAQASHAEEGRCRWPYSSYLESLFAQFPLRVWTPGTGCRQVDRACPEQQHPAGGRQELQLIPQGNNLAGSELAAESTLQLRKAGDGLQKDIPQQIHPGFEQWRLESSVWWGIWGRRNPCLPIRVDSCPGENCNFCMSC